MGNGLKKWHRLISGWLLVGVFLIPLRALFSDPLLIHVDIRGKKQKIFCYQPSGEIRHHKILFAPGDRGLAGFAVVIANNISSWGYEVYVLDTRRYLESFSGKGSLKITDVMSDLPEIVRRINRNERDRFTLVGWSEGAGLCLLAAAPDENADVFDGVITVGLTESNELGWHWRDFLTYITKKEPKEPMFRSSEFLPQISPLPLMMIQSKRDAFIPLGKAQELFSQASEPKQFVLIPARNHRFAGKKKEFFGRLQEGLKWVEETSH